MTEYVVLLMGDADRWWTTMTDEQRQEGTPRTAASWQSWASGGTS